MNKGEEGKKFGGNNEGFVGKRVRVDMKMIVWLCKER
jgi:hypothetical protein